MTKDKRWNFGGIVQYIDAAADRLGIPAGLADKARHNPEMHRAGTLVAQLAERYRRADKLADGTADVGLVGRSQVAGTLVEVGKESDKLHALAATAGAMLDEAYRAYGLTPPDRTFRVACDFDDLPSPADLSPIKPKGK